ncbi:MAG: helix-turn-helix transcriptional regulator [Bacteroidales bacterium]|jgi:transcriptional regulator with XRE-family HTH domain|nr:helix-turn-helix transcriptional regulator [Bacteroidales bacterium]
MSASERIGAALAEIRKEQGVSTYTLAKRVGMNQSAISRIEKGHISAGVDTIDRIAEALGSSLELVRKQR